jgi:hypothetical protein
MESRYRERRLCCSSVFKVESISLSKNNENPDELFQKDVACSHNSSENSRPTSYIEEFNNIEVNRDLAG